ncbi:MAG: 2OG-Fe(II) oxygenase [Candidatus Sericytochromatia bacterium]
MEIPALNPGLRMPYLVPGLFTPVECQQLIAASKQAPVIVDPYLAQNPDQEPGNTGERHRLTDPNVAGWVLKRLMQTAFGVNQQHFRFDIQGMEVPHIIEYHAGQQSYWHMDIADELTTNRKLSMLVFLSDPSSYAGGNFSVYPESLQVDQSQGNVLLFPAFLLHKVAPIQSGLRYSLVTWGVGPPFK